MNKMLMFGMMMFLLAFLAGCAEPTDSEPESDTSGANEQDANDQEEADEVGQGQGTQEEEGDDGIDETTADGTEYERVIVRLLEGVDIADVSYLFSTAEIIKELRFINAVAALVELEDISAIASDSSVAYVEPDMIQEISVLPNDPYLFSEWGLHNTGQNGGLNDADIDAPEAWDVSADCSNVTIAVLDTGVDPTHPDLKANLWVNEDEVPGNRQDDDGNGYVDDVNGYDCVNEDGEPFDDHSHGTHVLGTIAAAGDNNQGITGVCMKGRVMAVKAFGANGRGYTSDEVCAIEYAVKNGARVLNASWGGGQYAQALVDAIAKTELFVAAAGNNGSDNDSNPHYPSSYTLPNIIAVAATDSADRLAGFSNWGATSVDLAAPGVDIISTLPGGNYGSYSGTSMATPHVTGAAALVWSQNTQLTAAEVKDKLMKAVDTLPSLDGRIMSGGRLNLAQALPKKPDEGGPCKHPDNSLMGQDVLLSFNSPVTDPMYMTVMGNANGYAWVDDIVTVSNGEERVQTTIHISESGFVCFNVKIKVSEGVVYWGSNYPDFWTFTTSDGDTLCATVENNCVGGTNVCLYYTGQCD